MTQEQMTELAVAAFQNAGIAVEWGRVSRRTYFDGDEWWGAEAQIRHPNGQADVVELFSRDQAELLSAMQQRVGELKRDGY